MDQKTYLFAMVKTTEYHPCRTSQCTCWLSLVGVVVWSALVKLRNFLESGAAIEGGSKEMIDDNGEFTTPIMCHNPGISVSFIGVLDVLKFENRAESYKFSGNFGTVFGSLRCMEWYSVVSQASNFNTVKVRKGDSGVMIKHWILSWMVLSGMKSEFRTQMVVLSRNINVNWNAFVYGIFEMCYGCSERIVDWEDLFQFFVSDDGVILPECSHKKCGDKDFEGITWRHDGGLSLQSGLEMIFIAVEERHVASHVKHTRELKVENSGGDLLADNSSLAKQTPNSWNDQATTFKGSTRNFMFFFQDLRTSLVLRGGEPDRKLPWKTSVGSSEVIRISKSACEVYNGGLNNSVTFLNGLLFEGDLVSLHGHLLDVHDSDGASVLSLLMHECFGLEVDATFNQRSCRKVAGKLLENVLFLCERWQSLRTRFLLRDEGDVINWDQVSLSSFGAEEIEQHEIIIALWKFRRKQSKENSESGAQGDGYIYCRAAMILNSLEVGAALVGGGYQVQEDRKSWWEAVVISMAIDGFGFMQGRVGMLRVFYASDLEAFTNWEEPPFRESERKEQLILSQLCFSLSSYMMKKISEGQTY